VFAKQHSFEEFRGMQLAEGGGGSVFSQMIVAAKDILASAATNQTVGFFKLGFGDFECRIAGRTLGLHTSPLSRQKNAWQVTELNYPDFKILLVAGSPVS
jgi:hypothetical protein